MMYDELIKKLKSSVRWYEYGMPIVPSVCIEAAKAIEELQQQVEHYHKDSRVEEVV